MRRWTRTAPLDWPQGPSRTERWSCTDEEIVVASFDVRVRIGKSLDALGLKAMSLEEVRNYAAFLARTAAELYGDRAVEQVTSCPSCGRGTTEAELGATVFGATYRRCVACGHAFVDPRPTPEALAEVFAESAEHASTYTDPEALELRLEQVVRPKLAWLVDEFRRARDREPESVLDVGAGGGHFVEACRRAGLRAEGYEISKASRAFALETFRLELREEDFVSSPPASDSFDVVTFWGLLEYVPEPAAFLAAARDSLDPSTGMLVTEVPRFDCFGTAIQRERSGTVARHLDPTSHVGCFTDASLATALLHSGFRPVAAWYFGMDAYELVVQLALLLEDPEVPSRLAPLIPALQASLDHGHLCDDIVVAAVPED